MLYPDSGRGGFWDRADRGEFRWMPRAPSWVASRCIADGGFRFRGLARKFRKVWDDGEERIAEAIKKAEAAIVWARLMPRRAQLRRGHQAVWQDRNHPRR